MLNPLTRKLRIAGGLSDDDVAVLQELCDRARHMQTHHDLTSEGDRPEYVHLVMQGYACRYKIMADGQRHIIALLVPGDFCDLHVAILGEMDHSIGTLSPCTVAAIPRATILDLTRNHARIAHALWWATLVDEGILREWLVNLGQRQAPQRMAHLFCELLLRLQTVGLVVDNGFDFALTQTDLGDVLGLTAVHINRTLQELRAEDLIVLKNRRLEIPDPRRLESFCSFNPNYLHRTPRS